MRTLLTFENRSLNPNVQRVGLYWGEAHPPFERRPFTWQVVIRCPYLWSRPFDIGHEIYAHFVTAEGNYSPPVRLGKEMAFRDYLIRSRRTGGSTEVTVSAPRGHRYRKLQLWRGGAPMDECRLPYEGECTLSVSDRLSFAADISTRKGRRIDPREIGPGARSFDLAGLLELSVIMQGGAPGPGSEPIKFLAGDRIET